MQQTPGPLSAVAQIVADHVNSPPLQKNRTRAAFGAVLVTGCAYAAWWAPVVLGGRLTDVIMATLDGSGRAWQALLIWAGAFAFGVLWLVVGIKGARGPVDIMAAFWSAALPIGGALALVKWGDPSIVLDNVVLRGLCLSLGAGFAMEFFLSVRGFGGSALPLVTENIAANEFQWDDTT